DGFFLVHDTKYKCFRKWVCIDDQGHQADYVDANINIYLVDPMYYHKHDKVNFNYKSFWGKLNYLTQASRPTIIFAVHQDIRFNSDSHGDYDHWHQDMIQPDRGCECCVGANFADAIIKDYSNNDPVLAKT
ncbi:hypothetical protein ACHAXS_000393, partial [Conticribra weissflogii]